jgi:beta-N-acetylhexosaminidase
MAKGMEMAGGRRLAKRLSALLALVLLSFSLGPCAAQPEGSPTAREIVASMSLREKIAQLFFMDFRNWMTLGEKATGEKLEENPKYDGEPVAEMNGEIAKMLREYRFGGVILFSENLRDTAASVRLVREMQRAATGGGGLPLLLGVDQEGGNVTRLGQGTCLPGNMAIGATGRADYAKAAGAIAARELRAIGIGVNFSPVSDVNDNPQNPIINLRSFGSEPDKVAEMAVSMAEGIRGEGVVAVGKHFPGHGNTSTDSHTSLPRVEKDLAALRETELKPFQALIDAGIRMLMCAHIQFPAVDDATFVSASDGQEVAVPATFSHVILTDILRGEMGFDGVVITDAMNMDAIAKHISPADAVVRALEAGADMICMPVEVRSPADAKKIDAVFEAVEAAISGGGLPLSRIDESAERVVRLKMETGLLGETFDAAGDDEAVRSALLVVGCAAHRETEREIAEAAIALTRDELGALPFAPKDGETVLVVTPYQNEASSALFAFNRLKAEGVVPEGVSLETYCYRSEDRIGDGLRSALRRADYIVLNTEMSGTASLSPDHWMTALPTAVWKSVEASGKEDRFVHASVGAPFDVVNYEECPAELLSFGCVGMGEGDAESGAITGKYGPNLPALFGAIFGGFRPTGRIPVNVR